MSSILVVSRDVRFEMDGFDRPEKQSQKTAPESRENIKTHLIEIKSANVRIIYIFIAVARTFLRPR